MTKEDCFDSISKDYEVPKADVITIINAFIENIKRCLNRGESFTVNGFGTFELNEHKERKAMNVHSGEQVIIPKRKVPTFTFSKSYKDKLIKIVNNGEPS